MLSLSLDNMPEPASKLMERNSNTSCQRRKLKRKEILRFIGGLGGKSLISNLLSHALSAFSETDRERSIQPLTHLKMKKN